MTWPLLTTLVLTGLLIALPFITLIADSFWPSQDRPGAAMGQGIIFMFSIFAIVVVWVVFVIYEIITGFVT